MTRYEHSFKRECKRTKNEGSCCQDFERVEKGSCQVQTQLSLRPILMSKSINQK
uniref:Uncharacterized protein n=1 Tax=Utricularia reniformis TaxID=192314 RepID=A0A1Y0B3J6_9LAMI|nr:hypothetical protein AEK19_MT1821 [Utricularia reniformis]ART31992.1 hypothetical protein AEK19_MT1821 [Utricularia reniformis]